jgi:hypothetical protein
VGGNSNGTTAGAGGIGVTLTGDTATVMGQTNICGGGGAGGRNPSPSTAGGSGSFGGGNGTQNGTATSGTTYGSGGGGNWTSGTSAGNGFQGFVLIRYPDSFDAAAATTGSPTITVTGGYRYYRFTGSGSITF